MIDLETVGLTPNSAIVSIGAVIFDPRFGKVSKSTFYSELDWAAQNRAMDKGTLEWWQKQSEIVKEPFLYGMDDLEQSLKDLTLFLPKDCRVWGNGSIFDIGMLEDAYRQYGLPIPWMYWNIMDCRTIKFIFESMCGGYSRAAGGTKHNALDDAVFQAEYVCDMWRKILRG